ncbi:tyrosine-type recombinase/integrase [Sporosarcina sp. Marseille-Q4943]|uniref:tyrosine-type recombinase/integrase n=1 Tax=Sporosarcina sp. Marseille-Q4943 TaxID=2942204 RepID=UPI00208DDB90|nr:tyrosine-type recombinase/integrase [Sporosarcina sp. Marseille-Q4943]
MHCREVVKGKKWVCVADGPRDPATGKRRQISRTAKGKREAMKKVEDAIAELEYSYDYHQRITFEEYANEWYQQYLRRGRKETTNITRKYAIDTMNRYIKALQMKNITPKMYQAILNDLFDTGRSHSTIKMIHATARMIFGKAHEDKVIKVNPTSTAFIPQKKLTVEEIENEDVESMYLEPEELGMFLRETDRYKNYVYVALLYLIAFTGMRPGEAVALREKDALFDSSQINITKTLFNEKRRKGAHSTTPPKTLTSVRVVDVDEKIMDMLQELIHYKERMKFKSSEYLFSTEDGNPPTVDLVRQVVQRIGEKTEIKKHLYTYILRHTHISMLAEAGVGLPEIMKRVGHKNESTTTQIYLHVTKKMRESTMSKMNNLFGDLMHSERNLE